MISAPGVVFCVRIYGDLVATCIHGKITYSKLVQVIKLLSSTKHIHMYVFCIFV